MKRKFFAFIALITATFSLSSCLSSDDTTVEYTYDTAITSFSLGNLDRYAKTAAGKDTLLKSNVTGSNYKFYIDQTTRQIYNADSLPAGTRTAAVLATITSKNSSPVILMHAKQPENLDSAAYYSSTDSIDFSQPRKIRVYNNAFSAYTTYTVTVNVHQEKPYDFNWQAKGAQAALAALQDVKVLALGEYIYAFGKTAEGMKIYKTSYTDGTAWTEVTPNQAFAADDYQNAVVMDGNIFLLSGGKVYLSADAATWQQVGENSELKQLVGASSKYLYAFTATGISVSKDKGATWTAQKIDAAYRLLPTQNLSMSVSGIASVKDAENVLLLGTRDASYGDTIATTWTHVADYARNAPEYAWNYMDVDANQAKNMLPMMSEVITCAADTGYVALGSNGNWYKSKDNGLTWAVDSLITLPAEFKANIGRFGFCRDNNHFYWVIRNGYVWKGRYNIDGWRKD